MNATATAFLDGLRDIAITQLPGDTTARQQALKKVLQLGLPDRHVEAWKYSPPTALSHLTFPLPGAATAVPDIGAWDWGADAHLLVLVDGQMDRQLSRLHNLPAGVQLGAGVHPPALHDARRSAQAGEVFTWLNRALHTGGAELLINADVTVAAPIHLLYLHSGGRQTHLSSHIRMGANSRAQVVEHFAGLGAGESYLCNACSRLELGPGANLEHLRLQAHDGHGFHVGDLHASLARGSQLLARNFDFSAGWSRHNTHIALSGPGASVHLDGVYVGFGSQHVDNHSFIDHRVPHCSSRERYRGILGGKARGVFNGVIMVRKDAQKTDSDLSSAALLLGRGAEVDAKPELEIYADDVKCSHGATVGQLDETAVFYLRSRGIDASEARAMLTYSFAEEIIAGIQPQGLRRYLESSLLRQLPDSSELQELLA